jgi:hypothetical protein
MHSKERSCGRLQKKRRLDNAVRASRATYSLVRRFDNVWLREAAERQVPIIYFLGVSPARYQAIVPTFVVDWDTRALRAHIAFGELAGATAMATAPDLAERRYALRLVKQRLHQASFREGVLAAYKHRCAISNLPHDHLLDAAHIVADADQLLGQQMLLSGLALSDDPPSRLRQPPDRNRPRRPRACLPAATDAPRRPPP